MTHKKNGFLTFCFACLPGAGQMFLGFFKLGLSLMTIFFGTIAVASFLNLEFLVFVLPIIWFYSFFDTINRNSLSDEEFSKLEDHYLVLPKDIKINRLPAGKLRIILAAGLVLWGCQILISNLITILDEFFEIDYFIWEIYHTISYYLPQTIFSVLIIALGIYLIRGKRKSMDNEYQEDIKDNRQPGGEE